jgi:ATP-dependent DNA helicase RecG
LHVQVSRSTGIVTGTDGKPYVRRAAQNIPQDKAEERKRLEFMKGVVSFEGHPVPVRLESITESSVTPDYLKHVVSERPARTVAPETIASRE